MDDTLEIFVKFQTQEAVKQIQKLTQATDSAKKNASKFADAFNDVKKNLLGSFTAANLISDGIRAVGQALMDGVKGAIENEIALTQLNMATQKNAIMTEGASDRLQRFAEQLQKNSVYEDDFIVGLEQQLIVQGKTEEQTKKIIQTAVDLSAVMGTDLNTSVMRLTTTLSGTVGILGRTNPELKKLTDEELANGKAIDILAEKYQGFGKALSETTGGQMKKAQNEFKDLMEAMGADVINFLNATVRVMDTISSGAITKTQGIGLVQNITDQISDANKMSSKEIEVLLGEVSKLRVYYDSISGTLKYAQMEGSKYYDTLARGEKELHTLVIKKREQERRQNAELEERLKLQKKLETEQQKADEERKKRQEEIKRINDDYWNKVKDFTTQIRVNNELYNVHIGQLETSEQILEEKKKYLEQIKSLEESVLKYSIESGNKNISASIKLNDLLEQRKKLEVEITEIMNTQAQVATKRNKGEGTEAGFFVDMQKGIKEIQNQWDIYGDSINGVMSSYDKLSKNINDQEIARIESQIEERKKSGLETETLEKHLAERKNQIAKTEFENEKMRSMAEVAIKGAVALMSVAPNPIAMGLVAALTAAQIAFIGSQNYVPMAKGGIVTRPTNALIGEAGPEAVIPLSKMQSSGGNIIVIQNVRGSIWSEKSLRKIAMQEVYRYSRGR